MRSKSRLITRGVKPVCQISPKRYWETYHHLIDLLADIERIIYPYDDSKRDIVKEANRIDREVMSLIIDLESWSPRECIDYQEFYSRIRRLRAEINRLLRKVQG